jgi:hypothetical protein
MVKQMQSIISFSAVTSKADNKLLKDLSLRSLDASNRRILRFYTPLVVAS